MSSGTVDICLERPFTALRSLRRRFDNRSSCRSPTRRARSWRASLRDSWLIERRSSLSSRSCRSIREFRTSRCLSASIRLSRRASWRSLSRRRSARVSSVKCQIFTLIRKSNLVFQTKCHD